MWFNTKTGEILENYSIPMKHSYIKSNYDKNGIAYSWEFYDAENYQYVTYTKEVN